MGRCSSKWLNKSNQKLFSNTSFIRRDLDPDVFLDAPAQVMRETLEGIRDIYGSVEEYMEWIGFNEEDRLRLRAALLVDHAELN